MTQIEASDGTNSMPNPPPDITQLYQAIRSLIGSARTPQSAPHILRLAAPLNLIAFVAHAVLVTHQFRLKHTDSPAPPELATDWHALEHSKRSIHATYAHPRSSLSFELSFGKLGDRISISGITVETDKVFTHDLSTSGYFDEALFPICLSNNVVDQGSVGFRTTSHLLDFMTFFINDILHHLLPDLVPKTSPQTIHPNQQPPSPPPSNSIINSRNPDYPIPDGIIPSPLIARPVGAANQQSPFSIGQSDLDPIGVSDLRIPAMYNRPSNNMIPFGSNDGMLVGPNHAIFDHRASNPASLGPFGGDGFLPDGSVPSRARFDPIGPGPGFMPPGRGPGRGGNGFGIDPMGGLGQGLPMGNAFPTGGSMGSQGRDFAGYDDMFS